MKRADRRAKAAMYALRHYVFNGWVREAKLTTISICAYEWSKRK